MYRIVDVTINSSTWTPVVAPIDGDTFVVRNTGGVDIRISPDGGVTEDTLKSNDQFSLTERPFQLPTSGLRGVRFRTGDTILHLRSTSGTFNVKVLFAT